MKIKTYYLILSIAAGFFCAAASDQVEPLLHGDKALLINPPHPAFAGIDKLYLVVLQYSDWPDKDGPFFRQLETNIKEKLRRDGIELDTPTADNILTIPELRIHINTLRLEDSQQCVFHIRTALARAVCLKDEQNPVFKADIWQSVSSIQAVPAENMTAEFSDVVLEQVEDFIKIYKATNPSGTKASDTDININETASSTNPAEQTEKDINSTVIEYSYVASNSSNIFHKPDCRWAQNISKENLIKYKSREEAIKAGKRPCKTCNP
jgi:hypothetical protein